MKHLDHLATLGVHLDTVAQLLIDNAPACVDFNGLLIRAKYKTTRRVDIVKQWHHRHEVESIIYYHSPKAIKARADRIVEIANKQATVDEHLVALPDLNWDSSVAVLAWVDSIFDASDDVDVKIDMCSLRGMFASHGWETGANVGPYFKDDTSRNVAGYIVGQWLKCQHPMIVEFTKDWRAKFMPASNNDSATADAG